MATVDHIIKGSSRYDFGASGENVTFDKTGTHTAGSISEAVATQVSWDSVGGAKINANSSGASIDLYTKGEVDDKISWGGDAGASVNFATAASGSTQVYTKDEVDEILSDKLSNLFITQKFSGSVTVAASSIKQIDFDFSSAPSDYTAIAINTATSPGTSVSSCCISYYVISNGSRSANIGVRNVTSSSVTLTYNIWITFVKKEFAW